MALPGGGLGPRVANPHRTRSFTREQQPAEFEGATTVEDLLAYVQRGADEEEVAERASAVLDVEQAKDEDDQRVTLVGPLESILDAATADDDD